MNQAYRYPIGEPGRPWGARERASWLAQAKHQRSYQQDVVSRLTGLKAPFELLEYGALPSDPARYPLFAAKSLAWDPARPTALVTGGVHGYETSGVHGALQFLETVAEHYCDRINIVVAPCISPWGYETINRWNPDARDPNRCFVPAGVSGNSPVRTCAEAAAVVHLVTSLDSRVHLHIDLHETTDTDESEFRPALAARDGESYIPGVVPDGFYLVGDSANPQDDFHRAIIEAVAGVTHIAPADSEGKIIGEPLRQHGVITYAVRELGLCTGITDCEYGTTTEVYPDSPQANPAQCNAAQVAAVTSALEYLLMGPQEPNPN